MRAGQRTMLLFCLLLGGCAGTQYVTGDSRELFDTAKGMYGGNEFDARSTEGAITLSGQKNAKTQAPAPAAAGAGAKPLAAASVAPAPAATAAAPIAIDANAFAVVFGAAADPVKPTAEQLMRLDSLSLLADEAKRQDLQPKILACRRQGENCRLTHP
jgi:hypothetical protein